MSPFRKDETSRGILSFHDTHPHPHYSNNLQDLFVDRFSHEIDTTNIN